MLLRTMKIVRHTIVRHTRSNSDQDCGEGRNAPISASKSNFRNPGRFGGGAGERIWGGEGAQWRYENIGSIH